MTEQMQKIIETFRAMLGRDLSLLEFWQEFGTETGQEEAVSIDDLTAEIPETLSSEEDIAKLKEIVLSTLELCQKKKNLLKKLSGEFKDWNGI